MVAGILLELAVHHTVADHMTAELPDFAGWDRHIEAVGACHMKAVEVELAAGLDIRSLLLQLAVNQDIVCLQLAVRRAQHLRRLQTRMPVLHSGHVSSCLLLLLLELLVALARMRRPGCTGRLRDQVVHLCLIAADSPY